VQFLSEKVVRYPVRLTDLTQEGAQITLTACDYYGDTLEITVVFYKNGAIGFSMGELCGVDLVVSSARAMAAEIEVTEEQDRILVLHQGRTVVVGRDPYSVVVFDRDVHELWREIYDEYNAVGVGHDVIPPSGLAVSEEGERSAHICAALRYDEHFYGLGEHFCEFDRRGQRMRLLNEDTLGCRNESSYKNMPFYVSSYGYGLFVNSAAISTFDFGVASNACVSVRVPGNGIEWFLIPGASFEEIIPVYVAMTGGAAAPPDWSYGLWLSTGFHDSDQAAVLSAIEEFRKRGIPISVAHFDCYWMRDDMWCDFTWDEDRFPGHLDMLRQLREQGLRVCLWTNPYVTNKTEMFREGAGKGYFVKNAEGEVYLSDLWHGLLSPCAMVDFTNPEAKRWYQEKVKLLLLQGVAVCKTDFGEDIPLDSIFSNGRSGAEMRNIYSTLYNEAVFEATSEVYSAGETMVWARSGFSGIQRYPVCWSGDPRSSWQGMAATLRGGLSAALSGVLFWSHDVGGFYGPVEDDVYIRWLQFSIFSSHVRFHGTTGRSPWDFSADTERIATGLLKLRERLLPYILETARGCVEKGLPFITPLVMRHLNDPAVYSIWDEYYFGPDVIVAPVFGGEGMQRSFYLPEGCWRDYFTGDVFEGKQWRRAKYPLERFPLFVREGSALAEQYLL